MPTVNTPSSRPGIAASAVSVDSEAALVSAVSVLVVSVFAVSAVSFFAPQAVIATSISAASSKAIILLIVFSF